jgi:type III secretion system FlhB-like substrate exporter
MRKSRQPRRSAAISMAAAANAPKLLAGGQNLS